MKAPGQSSTRNVSSVRQSVTIPPELAVEVRRVAKKKHLTMSRALVELAQRGVEAEAAARANLNVTYRRFRFGGHVTVAVIGVPGALRFLSEQFGSPVRRR